MGDRSGADAEVHSRDGPALEGTESGPPSIDPGGAEGGSRTGERAPYVPPPVENFDWRGWLLVAVIFLSFVIVPVAIVYLQRAQTFLESLGLGLREAYLVLPLVPALLLGATAVWVALRSRAE